MYIEVVASELKDPICHSDECQIGSFSSEATKCYLLEATVFEGNYITTNRHTQLKTLVVHAVYYFIFAESIDDINIFMW